MTICRSVASLKLGWGSFLSSMIQGMAEKAKLQKDPRRLYIRDCPSHGNMLIFGITKCFIILNHSGLEGAWWLKQ